MILRYELPKEAEQVISLTDNERIYYAVPVDIDDAGNFLEDSYFIVTNRRLFVVEKGSIILIGATTENPSFEVNGKNRWRTFSNQF